jgi:hypothetical protein
MEILFKTTALHLIQQSLPVFMSVLVFKWTPKNCFDKALEQRKAVNTMNLWDRRKIQPNRSPLVSINMFNLPLVVSHCCLTKVRLETCCALRSLSAKKIPANRDVRPK